MNYQLTAEERESLITTDDSVNEWTIETSQKKIMTKLNKITDPYKTIKDDEGNIITAYYKLNFGQVSFRKPIQLSEEEKQKRRENILKARKSKIDAENLIDE